MAEGVLANGLEQEDIDRDNATVDTNDLVLEVDKELDMEHDEDKLLTKRLAVGVVTKQLTFIKVESEISYHEISGKQLKCSISELSPKTRLVWMWVVDHDQKETTTAL